MYYFVPYSYIPITIEFTESLLQQTLDGIFRIIYTWKVFAEPSTKFPPIHFVTHLLTTTTVLHFLKQGVNMGLVLIKAWQT